MSAVTPSAAIPGDASLAFLIVAHHQPNHLARLIRALDHPRSFFFVHIDRKVDVAPFRAAAPEQSNVVFLNDRVEVEWGKLSVVQATLALIECALASGRSFRYLNLLSGSDYPIKSRHDVFARLCASKGEFLRIDRKVTNDAADSHRHVVRDLPGGIYFGDFTPYHGSMYWSLTSDCIRYVHDFVKDNPGFVEVHRHVATPDEVFFHAILKRSPFAAAITQDFSGRDCPDHTHHANHYIDWTTPWPNMNLTLEERNLPDLLASTCLFARKFDETRSARLLDLLDQRVHKFGG